MHSVGRKIVPLRSGASRTCPKAYTSPLLVCLGDVRDLTLGGSFGAGDSGTINPELPAGWTSLGTLDGLESLP